MNILKSFTILAAIGLAGGAEAKPQSVAQIKQAIIRQSIADYPGNCPSPYNTARNGSRCGGRSAYNRPGGYAPKCYPSDVTDADVRAWRGR